VHGLIYATHDLLIGSGNVRTQQCFNVIVTERKHELILSAVKQQQFPRLAVKLSV
jgi:hypothetical protein